MSSVLQMAQRATDLERASAWYADLLGVPVAASFTAPGLVFFMLDGVRLLLDPAAPSALLYYRVDDIEATVERLRSAGTEIVSEPHVIFNHVEGTLGPKGTEEWQAFVRDSEGNLVGLAEHHVGVRSKREARNSDAGEAWLHDV